MGCFCFAQDSNLRIGVIASTPLDDLKEQGRSLGGGVFAGKRFKITTESYYDLLAEYKIFSSQNLYSKRINLIDLGIVSGTSVNQYLNIFVGLTLEKIDFDHTITTKPSFRVGFEVPFRPRAFSRAYLTSTKVDNLTLSTFNLAAGIAF